MVMERISQDFTELGAEMKVAEARGKLQAGYGVVWDNARPVTLITAEDLVGFDEQQLLAEVSGKLPPGIVVSAKRTMDAFVQSPAFAAFAIGARGAMVYEDEQIVGILTHETIRSYLQNEYEPAGEIKGFPSDALLPGSITNKPVIMYCEEFNHRNELDYYNRHKPPQCQIAEPHPHPIRKGK